MQVAQRLSHFDGFWLLSDLMLLSLTCTVPVTLHTRETQTPQQLSDFGILTADCRQIVSKLNQ